MVLRTCKALYNRNLAYAALLMAPLSLLTVLTFHTESWASLTKVD